MTKEGLGYEADSSSRSDCADFGGRIRSICEASFSDSCPAAGAGLQMGTAPV